MLARIVGLLWRKSQPTFKAVGAAVGGANPTITFPSYNVGDLLVLAGTGGQSAFTKPTGWNNGQTNANAPRQSVWYRIADGSEGASIAVSGGGGSGQMVALVYYGVSALDVNGTSHTTNSATASTNSLTTTVAGSVVISAFSEDTTGTVPGSITGTTIRYSSNVTGRSLVVADEIKTAAGATTSRSCVFGTSSNNDAFAIAFKP